MTAAEPLEEKRRRRQLRALCGAGFVTAFGAHAVAANLGGYASGHLASLWQLGILLALYDGAEVVLKPVFGVLADRIGARRVLIGGLVGFAGASAAFVAAGHPEALGLARLAQGASAAAFSPAASVMVGALGGQRGRGRAFGSYGAAKGLGYVAGPVVGGGLVVAGGYDLLFAVMAVLALAVAALCLATVPALPTKPKARQTVVALVQRLRAADFVHPVVALAGATAALSAAVGFLPVVGARHHLGPLVTGTVVSVLAAFAAVAQPWVGRALDEGRLSPRSGMVFGLLACALGLSLAVALPAVAGLAVAAVLVGCGVGVVTPLGFAELARSTPEGQAGTTMGAAEVGRELGDAGGPLLVGAVGALALSGGFIALGFMLAFSAAVTARVSRPAIEAGAD
jgi:MFS transporter, DHA1 family, tetracycline resistance protein